MKQSGLADLKLMGGNIPPWLYNRMKKLSLGIVEAILIEYGHATFLARLSDPFWFQSFASVIGMDWNSSGATTAVLRALKDTINPLSKELGLVVCGGKGKDSLETPNELQHFASVCGLDGRKLSRSSKLVAKVDNTAIQDGHRLYIHSFIASEKGDWTVIQQGMDVNNSSARRYHWHSDTIRSFVEEPHAAILGENLGQILNLTAKAAKKTKNGILHITQEHPDIVLKDIRKMVLPKYYGIKSKDVDIKRLGSILWLAQENEINQFEELLLLKGLGPRTLQSLTLVSEVIHGTPSRFQDPARFSFAHGGKGGSPFPVPTKIYDETISTLQNAVQKARIDQSDKLKALGKLSEMAKKAEQGFSPSQKIEKLIQNEQKNSWKYGGRTAKKGFEKPGHEQLKLF